MYEGKKKNVVFVSKKFVIIVIALLTNYTSLGSCIRRKSKGTYSASTLKPILTDLRLPNTLRPIHYDLCLQPFLNNSTFAGKVDIEIECLSKTDVITIHANNLTLKNESIELLLSDAKKIANERIISYDYDDKRQFFKFQLNAQLQPKQVYVLRLQFNGILNGNMRGFYTAKYDNDKLMATTQFEPTDARRAFPCFDEPALKANFTISLMRPKDLISISNMPQIENVDLGNNWTMDKYATTPRMSTYLLAFIVTKFAKTISKSDRGIFFGTYSRTSAISQTKFASEFGPNILELYDNYFNVSYPLPKLDMIAIPEFSSNAMENWGLITFKERALLFDENSSSVLDKETIAVVIAHEISHQWFGNLVSPNWWDYLWLNEGFATYMEYFAVDKLIPKWKMMERFLLAMHGVMVEDSVKYSHPIVTPVNDPYEIQEIFDSITYEKAASIIRMMFHFLGEDVFKNGLTAYLNDKLYGNVVQDDIWKHMTAAANGKIDIKRVMDTWTLQSGYPVVKLTTNNHDGSMMLSQEIFQLVPDNNISNGDAKWQIPITFTSKSKVDFSNTVPSTWMEKAENIKLTFTDGMPSVNEWIIVNIQQTGYYRVNYEKENWKLIISQLKDPAEFNKIHVLNRAQLIDDAFNLARADLLEYEIALDLTNYLVHENELVPWQTAIRNFAYIVGMLYKTEAFGLWEKLMAKIIKPQYNLYKFQNLDSNDDNHIKIIYQDFFVGLACLYKVDDCEAQCLSAFDKWTADPMKNKLSTSLRGHIMCKAIKKGGVKEWEIIWENFNASNVATEKRSFLLALTCTEEPWILIKLLNMILNPKGCIRSQDVSIIASGLSTNKIGHYLLFDYVRENLLGGTFDMPSLIKLATKNFNTPFELVKVKQLISDSNDLLTQFSRTMKQIIEEIESNIIWMKNNYKNINSWLESQS